MCWWTTGLGQIAPEMHAEGNACDLWTVCDIKLCQSTTPLMHRQEPVVLLINVQSTLVLASR
jgi:hypothetical protein